MAVNRRKKNTDPKIPFVGDLLKEGQWNGHACVILGGGPSLNSVIDRIDEFPADVKLAGPNQSWRLDPAPSVVYAIDKQLLDLAETGEYRERWSALSSSQIRVTNRSHAHSGTWASACWVQQIASDQWGTSFKEGIIAANNTGLGLLNIVDILGADPIILLGYDGKSEGKVLNWHQDYPDKPGWHPNKPDHVYKRWSIGFRAIAKNVKARVVNANLDSGYDMFEKASFENAAEICREKTKITS